MKVLVLSNGKFETREIENTLKELQDIVGGYIEIPYLGEQFMNNNIDVIINEEGKLIDGLNKEIAIVNKETESVADVIYGNCIFASHDEEGETIGLNDEQIEVVKNILNNITCLIDANENKIYTVRVLYL